MGRTTDAYTRYLRLEEQSDAVWQEIVDDLGLWFRAVLFGAAKVKPHHRSFRGAKLLALKLAELGIDVVTGGGDIGMMKAASEGAAAARTEARSIGCVMKFPTQSNSKALHKFFESRNWATRLRMFGTLGNVFICLKFGIGTLLELFFIAQQLQFLHKTNGYRKEHAGLYMDNLSVQHGWKPHIILVGRWYRLLFSLLKLMCRKMKTITEQDLAMFEFAPNEVVALRMAARYHTEWQQHMDHKKLPRKN